MSGGSYNYLYSKDVQELSPWGEDENSMLRRLKGEEHTQEVAKDLESLLEEIEKIKDMYNLLEEKWSPISHVLREVEWCDSGDSSEKDVIDACRDYKLMKEEGD